MHSCRMFWGPLDRGSAVYGWGSHDVTVVNWFLMYTGIKKSKVQAM